MRSPVREPKDRDKLRVVCEATRRANRRVLSDRRSPSVLRTWIAIQELLTTRTRQWDYTSNRQVADVAGICRRAVIDAVKELVSCGAIVWEPGDHDRLSVVRLAPALVNDLLHQGGERSTSPGVVNEIGRAGERITGGVVNKSLHSSRKGPEKSRSSSVVERLKTLAANRAYHDVSETEIRLELESKLLQELGDVAPLDELLGVYRAHRVDEAIAGGNA
jgi:hypothetical protein